MKDLVSGLVCRFFRDRCLGLPFATAAATGIATTTSSTTPTPTTTTRTTTTSAVATTTITSTGATITGSASAATATTTTAASASATDHPYGWLASLGVPGVGELTCAMYKMMQVVLCNASWDGKEGMASDMRVSETKPLDPNERDPSCRDSPFDTLL